jgi:hypothetical protein
MDRIERDDFMYALGQTMEFYGKKLERSDFAFWYSSMGDRSVGQIKTALKEYVKIGKFAPRPANIMEILNNMRPSLERVALPPPTTNCPPEIAKTWMWFIGRISQGSLLLDGLFGESQGADLQTQEKYLHVVNHDAKRLNTPDAIPDEYKIAEVWAAQT